MPTLYPAATYRPLGTQTQAPMRAHDLIVLHTMVGTLASTDAFFRAEGFTGIESHFGVGHDGTVLQWQDLDFIADAQLDANPRAISIETADVGPGFPPWNTRDGEKVPAWTGAQIEAIAHVVAWCCSRYGIPCELVPDSRPDRRGIGYHRLGVDPFRVPGGERWSTADGKSCPGPRRIAQIPRVLDRARALMNGDDMPLSAEDRAFFDKRFADLWDRFGVRTDPAGTTRDRLTDLYDELIALRTEVAELRAAAAAGTVTLPGAAVLRVTGTFTGTAGPPSPST